MAQGLHVCSEIGRLRTVMLHRPGEELLNLSPDNLSPLLFDDIPFLQVAQQEHDTFEHMLRDQGVQVLYLEDLVTEALDASAGAREEFTDQWLRECNATGKRVLGAVRERLNAIEDTSEFVRKTCEGVRADELDLTPSQASSLADLVSIGGDYSGALVVDPIPNTYFTRDDFTIIGRGVSINRMHTYTRRRETLYGEFIFRHHPVYGGAPRWYDRSLPYHIEGGDILILNANTLAVGMSERTEPAAIDLLAHEILMRSETSGIEHIYAFSIPHKRTFMHLDTVFTQVAVDTFTVHPGILGTLRVYELTRGRGRGDVRIRQMEGDLDQILARALGLPAVRLIKCGGGDVIAAAREQWNDGSNTLAVEPGKVFVYQRNSVTNDILYKAGIELLEVPSAELSRGRGGPHCMSMPFWRDDLA